MAVLVCVLVGGIGRSQQAATRRPLLGGRRRVAHDTAARPWRGLPGSAGSRRWGGRRSAATPQPTGQPKRFWLRETAKDERGFFLLLHSLPWHTQKECLESTLRRKKGCARHALSFALGWFCCSYESGYVKRTPEDQKRAQGKKKYGANEKCFASLFFVAPRWEEARSLACSTPHQQGHELPVTLHHHTLAQEDDVVPVLLLFLLGSPAASSSLGLLRSFPPTHNPHHPHHRHNFDDGIIELFFVTRRKPPGSLPLASLPTLSHTLNSHPLDPSLPPLLPTPLLPLDTH